MKWNEENVLFQDGVRVGSVLSHFYMKNGERRKRFEISTQDYMSSWEGIYYDTLEAVKRETERVVGERKLLIGDMVLSAIELENGNIIFMDQLKTN